MFVVTMHTFYGSSGEASQPDQAWLFPDRATATTFMDQFETRCSQLNPMWVNEVDLLLNLTKIENAPLATTSQAPDDIFDAWLAEYQPDWLNLSPADQAVAITEGAAWALRNIRVEALRIEHAKTCNGCRGVTYTHTHRNADTLNEDELLAEEQRLGLV